MKAKLYTLQESINEGRVESATSVRSERDTFGGRERWKIYLEGNGGLELFATGLRNDAANILTDKDELFVTVVEE